LTRPSLGGEAEGRSLGFISALVASGCFVRCICNSSTLAKISGLSMLSSMSAVVLRPSGEVTVISPSLTSNRPETDSPVRSWKVISVVMAQGPKMSPIDHSLEPQVADSRCCRAGEQFTDAPGGPIHRPRPKPCRSPDSQVSLAGIYITARTLAIEPSAKSKE
jgi:hypothetical protein